MVKLTSSTRKPNPEIQKIELTEEQKQEVSDLINGKPSKELLEKWDREGKRNRDWYEKHYQPMGTEKERLKKIRDKYFKGAGICMICHKLPLYKVIYKMQGISVVQHYCELCFDKWKSNKK